MDAAIVGRNAPWLCVPAIALCVLDHGLTLVGQSELYWSGDFSAVNEVSPSFRYFLEMHPLAFVSAGVLWILIFSSLTLLLPENLGLTVAITVVLGHMAGSATWLFWRPHGYQMCNALFLVTAALVVVSFKRGQSPHGGSGVNWDRTGLPKWLRWLMIAILFALPAWWFLIPH